MLLLLFNTVAYALVLNFRRVVSENSQIVVGRLKIGEVRDGGGVDVAIGALVKESSNATSVVD